MSKFFDYGEPTESKEGMYRIIATDTNMNKPNGFELGFWLYGKSENDIRELLAKKGYIKIKSIERKEMNF